MIPRRSINQKAPETDDLIFKKGFDQVTPAKYTIPGSLRDAQNVEININGGYTSHAGYERFDGQVSPSDATYAIFDVTITGSFSVGDTITGATSAATAVVIAIVTNGQASLVITKIVGTFTSSEDLEVSASVEGNADATPVIGGAPTVNLDAQYLNLAADEFRSDITVVTGSGSILGVWRLDDVVYAWRNNAGGTAAELYKSTLSGWSNIALGRELSFTSGGVTEIFEGDTITGAISGATAVLTRVMLETGSFAAGTAAGRFIFASQTGTFQAENIDVGASANLATIAGDGSAITMLPDGRFEFANSDFGGGAANVRTYGVDRVNRGFEFDGTVFAPINSTMVADRPNHVVVFENHLFFAFDGSAQHSGIGTPYIFSPIFGAAELAVGDTITGYKVQPGDTGNGSLSIFSRNKIHVLYGTSVDDWVLVDFRDEVGAFAHSIQEFGMTMFADDRGLTSLDTVQAYGNFKHNTLSRDIQPFYNERRTKVNASCIARDKSQYRIFFSDNSGIYMTTNNRKILGMTPILLSHVVKCIYSLEAVDGSEVIMFGSDDGFVYQMERGTSFDGESIEYFFTTHYNHARSTRVLKRYKNCTLEVSGGGYSEFNFITEIDYTSTEKPQPTSVNEVASFSGGRWDTGTWDIGIWDAMIIQPSSFKLSGSGENISILVRSNSDFFSPITYSGAQIRYLFGRQLR